MLDQFILECQDCQVDPNIKNELCPVCLTQKIMRGKWKIVIIFLLKDGPLRFSQIRRAIPKITQAYLSSQLKELEATGLITRHSYDEVPPRVDYCLTEDGQNFIEVINSMQAWGINYAQSKLGKVA